MAGELPRRAVVAGIAATAVVSLADCSDPATKTPPSETGVPSKQPTIYLPHGGGPWPWIPTMNASLGPLRAYLEGLARALPEPPAAIVCVTAHWEAPVTTLSTNAAPTMYYDYYGFPSHTYELVWGAPGAPGVARRVRALLEAAGIKSAEDSARGFDHGTFVPLAVAWPEAQVPTVQMSLVAGLDPTAHLEIGRALAPLRAEGVLIIGSGMSYHNMRGFGSDRGALDSRSFDAWIGEVVTRDAASRAAALARWTEAPAARASHPREEHLLPLMVAAGAAEGDAATLPFRGDVLGARVSAVHFG
ncbi:MAG: class III extradiol ring-cleavage dioxygenase [Nannocystaceae bacterium]|nr:dioxygenase [Myxococcales bacterium]